jgi:hypothetical protein
MSDPLAPFALVTLTDPDGDVYLRLDHICAIWVHTEGSLVLLTNGAQVDVTETPRDVVKAMSEAVRRVNEVIP